MVSAVMPTRGRREYAAQALGCFLSQTWREKELVILDDADCRSFENPPEGDNIKYILADKRYSIPEKRDKVCRIAAGEIIIHFDSDDWSAPERVELQVAMLVENPKKSVCGFRTMYFWDETKKQSWLYRGQSDYVLGTSLMFRKSWWARNKWDPRYKVASDNIFVKQASNAGQLIVSQVSDLMVARVHPGNTSPKRFGASWKKVAREVLPAGYRNEIERIGIGTAPAPVGV